MPTIYQKLAKARAELKRKGLKTSGENKFVGYTYFDLADILPAITEIELENGILSVVRYGLETATLTVYDAEKPEDYIEFTTPMSTAELKGCHPVQNLGAAQTYVRRYLYLAAYEVVEAESLDKSQGDPKQKKGDEKPDEKQKPTPKKQTQPRQTPPRQTPPKQTPRERLIATLKEKNIDIKTYAAENNVTTETTDKRYEELIAKLETQEGQNGEN